MYDVVNLQDLIARYFSSPSWLAVFAFSLVYLFLRSKWKTKKSILAAVIAFILIINAFMIKLFTKLDENSTFYRHLWAIPTIVLIGIAIVDMVRLLPKWYLQLTVITALLVGLWFINQQEYIRCRDQSISVDAKMISKDVIELGDELEKLKQESGKNTLLVVCPIAYKSNPSMYSELKLYGGSLNVYDSSILTNNEHSGEMELIGESPDVSYIMMTCCSEGIDYVIVPNQVNIEEIFRVNGFEPVFNTKEYLLYRCEGYDGYKIELTNWGQIRWKKSINQIGEPIENEKGFCKEEYDYDNRGRTIHMAYYDTNGKPVDIKEAGYSRVEIQYTPQGNLKEYKLFNSLGEPCIDQRQGYSSISFSYKGSLLMEKEYYNEKGERYNYSWWNPHAIIQYYYDDQNNRTKEKTLDKERNISKPLKGYWNEIRWTYDDNHNILSESYYCNEELIVFVDMGYAVEERKYDERGHIIQEVYLDENLRKINRKDLGYAERVIEYDSDGNIISEKYYDMNDELLENNLVEE